MDDIFGSPEKENMSDAASAWNLRLATVEEIHSYLEYHFGDAAAAARLKPYIDDEKWEVRAVVANCMVQLREEDIPEFIHLLKDVNSFVAGSAKRALERRNIYTNGVKKRERQTSILFRNGEKIREKFGPEAAELARQDAEYAYEVTVGSAAHDIRGIITPMVAKYEQLRTIAENALPVKELQEFRKCMSILSDRTEMIERIIDDMQTLARKTPEDRTQEGVADLLRMANEIVREEFRAKNRNIDGIRIEIDVPADLMFRVARPLMIRVFCNLLKNAMESFIVATNKFADSGLVEVKASRTLDGIEIAFRDHGMGMPPEYLKKIRQFRPRSTSKKTTGSGFGLAIAYAKIFDHDGTLSIDSKENEGTVVTVFLPNKVEK